MRIAATLVLGAALVAGCSDQAGTTSPATMKPAAKAPPYFELTGADGATYVFGSVDSMLAYRKSGKLPAITTAYFKSKAFNVEDAYSERLIAEFQTQHK